MFSDWDTVKVDIYIHTWPTIFPVQDDPILPLKWSITLHGLVDIAHSWSLPQSKWMFLIVVMQLPQCATCIWSAARTQVQWIWKCKINWLFFVVVSTAFKKNKERECQELQIYIKISALSNSCQQLSCWKITSGNKAGGTVRNKI